MSTTPSIKFDYEFTSDKDVISFKRRKDVPTILNVSARLTIYINDEVYVDVEEVPVLEFYKSLFKWVHANEKYGKIQAFHYYSIEYDEDAILSFIPFANRARFKTCWEENQLYNIFDLEYIVQQLNQLEKNLKSDIEDYFGMELKDFIRHIPSRIMEWKKI